MTTQIPLNKYCRTCKQIRPKTFFSTSNTKPDGYVTTCRICVDTRKALRENKALEWPRKEVPTTIKYCPRCEKYHYGEDFYYSSTSEDGKANYCKHCYHELSKSTVSYAHYSKKLAYADKVREGENGELLAACKLCNTMFAPTRNQVVARIKCLTGIISGECNFYCSTECKNSCSIYNYKYQDTPDYGLINSRTRKREVPKAFIKLALEDRNYTCEKCGTTLFLHVHHIEGIVEQPMLSCDLCNVLVVCRDCHHAIHSQPGCGYNDYRCS